MADFLWKKVIATYVCMIIIYEEIVWVTLFIIVLYVNPKIQIVLIFYLTLNLVLAWLVSDLPYFLHFLSNQTNLKLLPFYPQTQQPFNVEVILCVKKQHRFHLFLHFLRLAQQPNKTFKESKKKGVQDYVPLDCDSVMLILFFEENFGCSWFWG